MWYFWGSRTFPIKSIQNISRRNARRLIRIGEPIELIPKRIPSAKDLVRPVIFTCGFCGFVTTTGFIWKYENMRIEEEKQKWFNRKNYQHLFPSFKSEPKVKLDGFFLWVTLVIFLLFLVNFGHNWFYFVLYLSCSMYFLVLFLFFLTRGYSNCFVVVVFSRIEVDFCLILEAWKSLLKYGNKIPG